MLSEQNFDPTKPSANKTVYLALVVVLGIMVGFLLSLLVALAFDLFSGSRATAVFLVCILAGIWGGLYVGPRWWQYVYVDRRRHYFHHWHCQSCKK